MFRALPYFWTMILTISIHKLVQLEQLSRGMQRKERKGKVETVILTADFWGAAGQDKK